MFLDVTLVQEVEVGLVGLMTAMFLVLLPDSDILLWGML
jgi:hypothetical protein